MKELTLHLEEERLSLQDQRDQVTREHHTHCPAGGSRASHILWSDGNCGSLQGSRSIQNKFKHFRSALDCVNLEMMGRH